jgi:hypothetical protein
MERASNEELHKLYSSPSLMTMIKSRMMRFEGHVARTGRTEMHIRLWLMSEGNRPTQRLTRTVEDNIKMDLRQDWAVWTGLV